MRSKATFTTLSHESMIAGTFFTRRLAALTGLNTSNVTRRHTAAQQRFDIDGLSKIVKNAVRPMHTEDRRNDSMVSNE